LILVTQNQVFFIPHFSYLKQLEKNVELIDCKGSLQKGLTELIH